MLTIAPYQLFDSQEHNCMYILDVHTQTLTILYIFMCLGFHFSFLQGLDFQGIDRDPIFQKLYLP